MTETTTAGRECSHPARGAEAAEPAALPLRERHAALWDADWKYNELAICAEELIPHPIGLAHLVGNAHLEEILEEDLEQAREWTAHWRGVSDGLAGRASLRPTPPPDRGPSGLRPSLCHEPYRVPLKFCVVRDDNHNDVCACPGSSGRRKRFPRRRRKRRWY